jgi:hypothetical protein
MHELRDFVDSKGISGWVSDRYYRALGGGTSERVTGED